MPSPRAALASTRPGYAMSRLPLEQMMASFRPVVAASPKSGTMEGPGSTCVVVMVVPFSYAAVGLGQSGDVGHLLARFGGEQREQVLDRDTGHSGHPAQRGGLALFGVVGAQEADDP